jgi:hypothetical protein
MKCDINRSLLRLRIVSYCMGGRNEIRPSREQVIIMNYHLRCTMVRGRPSWCRRLVILLHAFLHTAYLS